MGKYDRTVKAALSETDSKFRLAEALALDIPAKSDGDGTKVNDALVSARGAIVKAGGEERSIPTLNKYRRTAIWVSSKSVGNPPIFEWVPGASYTAHEEAMGAGLSIDDFKADPTTARRTRTNAGKASKDGDPKKVVAGWSPAQRAAAVAEVAKTEGAEVVAKAAIAEDLTVAASVTGRELSKAGGRALKEFDAAADAAADGNEPQIGNRGPLVSAPVSDSQMLVNASTQILNGIKTLTEWAEENAPLSAEYEASLASFAQDIQVAAAALEIMVATPASIGSSE